MISIFPSDKPENPKIELLGDIPNPLQPCPETPNCVRRSYKITIEPSRLLSLSLEVVRVMGANIENESQTDQSIHAIYSVLFFKDDVNIIIEDTSGYSLFHVRSASRKGSYDFGVNKRRINRFIQKLGERL